MNILFLGEGDKTWQSTLHRCYFFAEQLEKYGHTCEVFGGRKKPLTKTILPNFKSSLKAFTSINNYDVIIIQRSADPINFLISNTWKRFGKKVIFDFDDAIFLLKNRGIIPRPPVIFFDSMIRKSDAVTVGSHYLYEYSIKRNINTRLVPTPVNTNIFYPRKKYRNKNVFVIGWLGVPNKSHIENLKILIEPLKLLGKKYDIKFKMVSSLGNSEIKNSFKKIEDIVDIDYGFKEWIDITEIPQHMIDFDIGVMPLTDTPFNRGKCAMKALECMAMKIPVVVSDVGENRFVIKDGENGFLASNTQEWVEKIEMLINDDNLRREISERGYKTVMEKYSLDVCAKELDKIISNI